jgi:hypothetical protein
MDGFGMILPIAVCAGPMAATCQADPTGPLIDAGSRFATDHETSLVEKSSFSAHTFNLVNF